MIPANSGIKRLPEDSMEKKMQKKMLTPSEVEEIFSVPRGTLANWRSFKRGPRYYKVNAKVLYRLEDLESFFTCHPVETLDSYREHGEAT
jgi:hypothetical protein